MSKAGFSLIEILVAMSILAVVAAVAIPNFHRFSSDTSLSNATQDLLTAFRVVQSNAQSGMVCPNDNQAASEWDINLVAGPPSVYQSVCVHQDSSLSNWNGPVTTLPAGITFGAPYQFEFSPLQIRDGAGNPLTSPQTITLTQSGSGSTSTITINPGGGINVGT